MGHPAARPPRASQARTRSSDRRPREHTTARFPTGFSDRLGFDPKRRARAGNIPEPRALTCAVLPGSVCRTIAYAQAAQKTRAPPGALRAGGIPTNSRPRAPGSARDYKRGPRPGRGVLAIGNPATAGSVCQPRLPLSVTPLERPSGAPLTSSVRLPYAPGFVNRLYSYLLVYN